MAVAFLGLLVRPWEEVEGEPAPRFGRLVLGAFGVGSLAILGVTVMSYLGIGAGGSPRVPDRSLVRIQQTGLYVAPSDGRNPALLLTGDAIRAKALEDGGFQIPSLRSGQRVRLEAVREGNRVQSWRVSSTNMDVPVRIGDRSVNAVPGGWLTGPETVVFAFRPEPKGPERYLAIGIDPKGAFSYAQGTMEGGRPVPDGEPVRFERSIREGIRLSTLLGGTGTLQTAWQGRSPLLLTAGGLGVPAWEVVSGVMLIRETKGDEASRLAVLIDPALAERGVRVRRGDQSLDLTAASPAVEVPASEAGTLAFGLSGARRFALRLPVQVEDGGRLAARLEVPISYPLPPQPKAGEAEKPFLLTSGRDMVPMDGYVFATGNDGHPFYAKAIVQGDRRDALRVQDGATNSTYRDDQEVSLGDGAQGILMRLHVNKPDVPGAGRLALLALGLGGAFYLLALFWRPRGLSKADVAWAALWVAVTAMLVVRLLLAYRVSLVPPDDATASELASFHKALRVSLGALFLIPAAMAAVRVRWVAHRKQKALEPLRKRLAGLPHAQICLWLGGVACLVPILARILGTRNDLFGVRTSIWGHLLVVGALCSFAVAAGQKRDPVGRYSLFHPRGMTVFVGLLWLSLLLLVVAIGDNGTVLYAMSIGLALVVAWVPFRMAGAKGKAKIPTGVAFALGAAAIALVALALNRTAFLQRYERLSGTVGYRLATLDDLEPELLLNPKRTEYVEVQQVRNNREQEWQMLLYAAVGASNENPGYGGLPLSKVGIKYPTSLTDTVYAVYLLGEFGPWAGAWATALYLAIMGACFAGAMIAHRERAWTFVPLVAIGGFFATNGIYMAASNVGAVPFTGQNLPLLSLYSQGDAMQGLLLLVLASLLLKRQTAATVAPAKTWSAHGVPIYAGAMGLLWFAAARSAIGMPPEFARDHDNPEVIRALARRIEAGQVKVDDRLRIDEGKIQDLTPIEKEAIRDFNLRPNKVDASSGLYYLERNAREGYDLRVNPSYFHIPSPYKRGQGVPWRGSIVASGTGMDEPRLYMLSNPLSLSLDRTGFPEIVYIDSPTPERRSNAAILAARSRLGRLEFGEYRRTRRNGKTVVTLKAKRPQGGMDWRVSVEGKPVPDRGRELEANDIVTIEDRTSRPSRRYNLIFLGTQPEPLAFVRWRNGTYRRVLPGGAVFGLAEALGHAGDEVRAQKDLRLTLDLDLHRRLQTAVRDWALSIRGRPDLSYGLEDPVRSKDVSMAILDTHSGDVLALPSFPHVDPSDPGFLDLVEESGPVRRRKMLTNWNLENHVIGSTIKPLTFAAVASGLRDVAKVEDVVVHARTLSHDRIGTVPLEKPTGEYSPLGDLAMGPYLTNSYTWPAVIVGALGLVETPQELKTVLVPTRNAPDLSIGGTAYRLDLLRSPDRVFSQDPTSKRWTLRTNLSDTVLFRSLVDLYGIQTPANKSTQADYVKGRAGTFLPSFTPKDRVPTFLDDVLPRRVLYESDSMRSVRSELVTTLIGGAQSSWNNVAMAEAFARLSTGKKVRARLERGAAPSFDAMPAPLSTPEWREAHLMGPLERVHQTGTARGITADWNGYRAVMKTGTLGEQVDSESLMFTVGRWRNGGFVPGDSVTGYLFMRDTNNGGNFMKFGLANKLFPILVEHLQRQAKRRG
ncbi:MAG: hypothetical protein ACO1SV_12775 [Fimbriimonas sp.]